MRDFESWYRDAWPEVARAVLLASFNQREVAADATSEAFARAFERWDRVSRMESPEGWTVTVAVNLLRRGRRGRAVASLRDVGSVEDGFGHVDERERLARALAKLSKQQRKAILLRYVLDLTQAEIAEVMNIAPGTVAATLHAARKRLGELARTASAVDEVAVDAAWTGGTNAKR